MIFCLLFDFLHCVCLGGRFLRRCFLRRALLGAGLLSCSLPVFLCRLTLIILIRLSNELTTIIQRQLSRLHGLRDLIVRFIK